MSKSREFPYRISWIDKFFNWIENLPIPVWLTYLVLYILCIVYVGQGYIQEGVFREGFGLENILISSLWIPVGLIALHWMKVSAQKAMAEFQRIVKLEPEIFDVLLFKMSTLPRSVVWICHGIVAVLILLVVINDPTNLGSEFDTPLFAGMGAFYMAVAFSLFFLVAYQTVRQLRIVSKATQLVEEINIFHFQSLYSLSGLTARIGVMWVFFTSLNFFFNYVLEIGPLPVSGIILMGIFELTLALLVFILPLWGVHVRIRGEKERLLEENSKSLEKLNLEMNHHIQEGTYRQLEESGKWISTTLTMRKELEQVSTWPWRPTTLRGFISAVFLPLGLYLVQQLLASLFDF